MLEDITMEKKLTRPSQSPKGIAEVKKNQDVPLTKVHSRPQRKREKVPPPDEQPRKPSCSTSKGKQFNRKSSSRSSYHQIGGKVAELADDDFDLKRSKKQNLAHLLNIQCKPRESYLNTSYRSASKAVFPYNSIRYLMSTQKHKYNKEQFLQANCQFVVRNDADYSIHMAEPDILVDWNLIEQIRVPSFEPVSCPICLETPIAGKITRCGHIYCWPCILHYLALTDQTWYKCPICYEAIHTKDLKSVQIVNQTWFDKGQEITFQLMKREKGSTISVPVLEQTRTSNVLLSVSENHLTTVYSKLLLIDNANILQLIQTEESQLLNELKETEGTPEKCFVAHAIELLGKRKVELFARDGTIIDGAKDGKPDDSYASGIASTSTSCETAEASSSKSIDEAKFSLDKCSDASLNAESNPYDVTLYDVDSATRIRYESVSSNDEIPSTITAEDLEIEASNAIPSQFYYFYQAIDGQQIYLHSLNARMLEKQYGSLEKSPPFLVGNIVEIEMGSMTEELRKRLRYLDHLPITCQFQVVEINLEEPLISDSTKMFFKDQLEKRSRLRQKKAKEEKRLEKRAEMMAREQYGCGFGSSPVRLHLDSLDHFPQCGAEEATKLSQRNKSPRSSRSSSPASSRRSVSPVTSGMDTMTLNSNTFAQKLKDTRKDNGWQKRVKANSESDANGSSYSRNFISDAVEAALQQARLVKEGGEQSFGKKRKKKPKPIPLCSVGVVYHNS